MNFLPVLYIVKKNQIQNFLIGFYLRCYPALIIFLIQTFQYSKVNLEERRNDLSRENSKEEDVFTILEIFDQKIASFSSTQLI